jgi:hypothetical protein
METPEIKTALMALERLSLETIWALANIEDVCDDASGAKDLGSILE